MRAGRALVAALEVGLAWAGAACPTGPTRPTRPCPPGLTRPAWPTRLFFCALMFLLCVAAAAAQAEKQPAPPTARAEFRVCADPENLPASNRKLEGFENKIAAVMAKELGAPLSYVWWGQRRGFIRNTMNATLKEGRCDVMIGVPQGYDLVQTTRPYYRSTYVFVYPKGKGLQIKSLDDPILKKLRIGVHLLGDDYANPPPVHALSQRGIVGNVVGFDTFYSRDNPPDTIIEAVVERTDRRRDRVGTGGRKLCRPPPCAAGDGAGSLREKGTCRSPSTSRWA